jgi:pSer/pThr/pTyr-binding forkhead associated (FHA) protein
MIQGVMGFSATETGLSQLPTMGMIIVMGPIIGKQIGKVGPGPLLTVGMAALVVSFLFFYPLDFGSDFWDLLPGMVIGGFGFATVLTPLTAAALSGVPMHQAGMGAACINSTRQVGGALGLAVMGAISAEVITASLLDGEANPEGFVNGFGWLMVTGAGVSALGAIAAWTMIARPARAAAKAAAAAAAAAPPPEPEPAPAEAPAPAPAAEPEEVGVEYSRNWAIAAPSVVSALPASLADRAALYAGPALEVIDGKASGTRIRIGDEGLVLGRGESGEGALAGDPELSRRHAAVTTEDGGLMVEDLGSTNGTLVNGREISAPTAAAPGDTIEVGSTTLRVLAARPRAAPAGGLAVKVVAGPAAGARIVVGPFPVVFGRAEAGEGSLGGDPELSRRHASASLLDGARLLVEDLGSTNGTFVNEHRIGAPTVVRTGDSLRLGTSTLEVEA